MAAAAEAAKVAFSSFFCATEAAAAMAMRLACFVVSPDSEYGRRKIHHRRPCRDAKKQNNSLENRKSLKRPTLSSSKATVGAVVQCSG